MGIRLQMDWGWVPCPCCDCSNVKSFRNMTQIRTHLIKRGFVAGYECWTNHGERIIETGEHSPVGDQCHGNQDTVMDDYVQTREVQESEHTSPGEKCNDPGPYTYLRECALVVAHLCAYISCICMLMHLYMDLN